MVHFLSKCHTSSLVSVSQEIWVELMLTYFRIINLITATDSKQPELISLFNEKHKVSFSRPLQFNLVPEVRIVPWKDWKPFILCPIWTRLLKLCGFQRENKIKYGILVTLVKRRSTAYTVLSKLAIQLDMVYILSASFFKMALAVWLITW